MSVVQSRLLVDEAVTTERMLAFVRSVLALATLVVAVKLYYEVQFEYRPMALTLLIVLTYTVAMSMLTRHKPAATRGAAMFASVFEVALITALIASTGGTKSPFYLWYVFYIVSVSLRYGLQLSILALAASIISYTIITTTAVSLSLAGETFIPAFLGSTGFLFILALLFGHMSEKQKSYRTQLAVVNELGIALSSLSTPGDVEKELVRQAAGLLQVEKCWFAAVEESAELYHPHLQRERETDIKAAEESPELYHPHPSPLPSRERGLAGSSSQDTAVTKAVAPLHWTCGGSANGVASYNQGSASGVASYGDAAGGVASYDLGEWAPERLVASGQARMTNDARADESLPEMTRTALGIRSLAAAPLLAPDAPVGAIYAVNRQNGSFSAADMRLLDLITGQAAPLLENARLAERVRETAANEERLRIARDLHDNFLQTLAAIKLHLERCSLLVDKDTGKAKSAIDRTQEIAAAGLAEVRSYLTQLRLAGPEPGQLREAIQRFVKETAASAGFEAQMRLEVEPSAISDSVCSGAFQIVRELVNNAAKHARAANVEVVVETLPEVLTLTVRDDGSGFDVEEARRTAAATGHLGLVGVEERVGTLGGTIAIESSRGRGTRVSVSLPLCGER